MNNKTSLDKELNVMVALDLTQMDPILIQYVSFLNSIFNIKNLHFVHNLKQSVLYGLYEDFISEDIEIDKIVEEELKRTIATNHKDPENHTLTITSDNYTESVLSDLVKQHEIDVMIVGNKNEFQGTGALSQKLVRMLNCHLLLVPEKTQLVLEKILVPTDFSSDSALSIHVAMHMAKQSLVNVEAFHVYGIPAFFFPYIDSEKAHEEAKNKITSRFLQYRKKHNLPEEMVFKYLDKKEASVVETIEEEAVKQNFDMIVVSARGANNLTSLFIGSITNELVIRNRTMPLLVVKKR